MPDPRLTHPRAHRRLTNQIPLHTPEYPHIGNHRIALTGHPDGQTAQASHAQAGVSAARARGRLKGASRSGRLEGGGSRGADGRPASRGSHRRLARSTRRATLAREDSGQRPHAGERATLSRGNATSCTVLDYYREHRRVRVLHDGAWYDGWLAAFWRDSDGWWASTDHAP